MRNTFRRFAVVACLVLPAAVATAQASAAFEVASIKPAAPLDMAKLRAEVENGQTPRLGAMVDGARAEYIYLTLQDLITVAYKVKAYQITGPDWMTGQRFDIFAKMPDGASKDDAPKMLQALLEDRFKLTLHRESREHPVLALVVGKRGPRMKESEASQPIDETAPLKPGEKITNTSDGPVRTTTDKDGSFAMNMGAKGKVAFSRTTQSTHIEDAKMTMEEFATELTTLSQASGGPEVRDLTGLKGNYQVSIDFSLTDLRSDLQSVVQAKGMIDAPNPPAGAAMPADAASDPGGSLLCSVKSMGLNLESRKVPVEQLVIDHIKETPTEN